VSTPALTPCYTNLSDKAPTLLTFQYDIQQSELINNKDADKPSIQELKIVSADTSSAGIQL
jgi:hypothetical protein